MNPAKDAGTQLQPLPVILSALHLPPGISALHLQSGIEVYLPKSGTRAPIRFKAVVSESTNMNLLLKSFYDANVSGKVFDETEYVLSSLADQGISRCAFTTTFGMMKGQPTLNDQTAPQFRVGGLSHVPFTHQGYLFSPAFLICDHIFCRQEYETEFVAVLSLDFLREYFIRAQFTEEGWMIQLPPPPPAQINELPIFTDGCCMYNGKATQDPEAKPAAGGYGIHFPTLPNGWDMYGALAVGSKHTNQKAELIAVIRALQLVRLRKIPCGRISIFTDSKYAVHGLNDWIPDLWRSNGYRTTKNCDVVNADLFRSLDEEVSRSIESGIPVMLSHVPRGKDRKADALSKLGAASGVPFMTLGKPDKGNSKEAGVKSMGKPDKAKKKGAEAEAKGSGREDGRPEIILGKNVFKEWRPLVQWSPDGVYWAKWDSTGESLESGMEMLVV